MEQFKTLKEILDEQKIGKLLTHKISWVELEKQGITHEDLGISDELMGATRVYFNHNHIAIEYADISVNYDCFEDLKKKNKAAEKKESKVQYNLSHSL
jgi:hypothetical protein